MSARLIRRITLLAATIPTAVAIAAANPATAGTIASSHAGSAATRHVQVLVHSVGNPKVPAGALANCGSETLCSYNGLSGANVCLDVWLPEPDANWGSCRNKDESFAYRAGGLVRLYFSPNYQGAYACVNDEWYSNNLNKAAYTFNNGGGAGAGQEIWENIASSKPGSGSCANPLPEDG
jgi:hypothetical protein